MKIAIIGSGITGLTVALSLQEKFDLTLFEKESRVGGHSNTIDIELGEGKVSVDTGFIVFNNKNYPLFSKLLDFLDVRSEWSDMSFGFSLNEGKMEYACDNLDKIFSQRSNLFNPNFVRGFLDLLRFQKESVRDLFNGSMGDLSLGSYLEKRNFSKWLQNNYLLPLGASIWSSSTKNILDFPAKNFVTFFKNHDLMTGLKPAQRWKTISGGSRVYVDEIISRFNGRVETKAEVVSVFRNDNSVKINLGNGASEKFDHVIFCCNAPTIDRILSRKSAVERNTFDLLKTSSNKCVIHSDDKLMPRRKKVWSSWNFLSRGEVIDKGSPISATYWMNRLQNINCNTQIFLSLNPQKDISKEKIFSQMYYEHPVMNEVSFKAQEKIKEFQGNGNVWFAGAWLGNGFHEDGVVSALEVCKNFVELPRWTFHDTFEGNSESLQAAE